MAAWLPLRLAQAVVPHASALEMYELSNVIPDVVHVSVPQTKRGSRPRPGVRIHTMVEPLDSREVRAVAGVVAAAPERSIVDTLEDGEQPEQIERAIQQALRRGLTTESRLRVATAGRSARVREFVDDAVAQAGA